VVLDFAESYGSMKIIEEDVQRILAADLPWASFAGKTVLIAGAAGFLPAYMVETLMRLAESSSVRVIALVRNIEKAERRFRHLLEKNLVLLQHDVTRPLELDMPVDFIVHAASQASPKFYLTDPVGTFTANVLGTYHLLELARNGKDVAFLLFSSGEVYGQSDKILQSELDFGYLDPATVRACYGEGKRASETLCVAYSSQFGVRTTIVRPFHTYGPGMALDDGRVFADFVANILDYQDLVIKSDGSARRPFCYIADAVEAFFTVLLKGATATPYNVGNEEAEVSILELAQILSQVFADRSLKVIVDPNRQSNTYLRSPISRNCPDTARLRALGWRPRLGVAEGFRRTVASYESSQV
jgi:UDP-glucuronate decarboxylase